MAENYTPNNVQTFVNDTTAVSTVNSNFSAISNVFTDVLSRSGVSPNQMTSNLDMNGNQIINLPPPATVNSPARLIDVTGGNITITTATTGTSGHAVPFLDGNNTWSNTQTITMPTGLSAGLVINEQPTGSNTGSTFNSNSINITNDNVQTGSFFGTALGIYHTYGGSTQTGGRETLNVVSQLGNPTNAGNTNRNYVAIVGQGVALTGDNGTGLTSGTSAGAVFGGNFLGVATAGATNLSNVCATEFNTNMVSGSSVYAKSLCQFSGTPSDVVAGSGVNTMLWLYNQNSASAKWNNAILIDNANGSGSFPMSGSGTVFKTGTGSTGNGIDLSSTTFSTWAFLTQGFGVTGTGSVNTGQVGVLNGTINFLGSTSGSTSITTNSTGAGLNISQTLSVGTTGTTGGSITLFGLTSGSAVINVSSTLGTLQLGSGNISIDTSGNLTGNGRFLISALTAAPAGGSATTAYLIGNGSPAVGLYWGTGNPTVSAGKGSLYMENGTGQLWLNTSGSTTWTQVTVP